MDLKSKIKNAIEFSGVDLDYDGVEDLTNELIKIFKADKTSEYQALNIADVSESYLKKQIRIQIEDCEQKLNELIEHDIGDSDTAKMMWHLQQDISTFNLFLNSR